MPNVPNPFLDTITLAVLDTNYQLWERINTLLSISDFHEKCESVQLQVDPNFQGSVYIINSGGTASRRGVEIIGGQAWSPPQMEVNRISLKDIWLRSDTNSTQILCSIFVA